MKVLAIVPTSADLAPWGAGGGFRTKSVIAFCIGIALAMYWHCIGNVGTKRDEGVSVAHERG
jgi:hypothetical protein